MENEFVGCIIEGKRGYGMSMYHIKKLLEQYKVKDRVDR